MNTILRVLLDLVLRLFRSIDLPLLAALLARSATCAALIPCSSPK